MVEYHHVRNGVVLPPCYMRSLAYQSYCCICQPWVRPCQASCGFFSANYGHVVEVKKIAGTAVAAVAAIPAPTAVQEAWLALK